MSTIGHPGSLPLREADSPVPNAVSPFAELDAYAGIRKAWPLA